MANKFYAPGEQRAAKVRDLFARVAPHYDLINDLQSFGLHRHWKRRLIRLAEAQSGQWALDLCCGTGDIAFALARGGLSVVGLDFSAPMLAIARQRQQAVPTLPVQFLRGDALQIPFPDDCFDRVTIGYGLRNLANLENGLLEMWRVTRPGGRVLVLDFGKPDNRVWRGLYFGYLKWFVPLLGRLLCGDADTHAYILESLKHYPGQQAVAAKMRELNFINVRVVNLLGGLMSINGGAKPAKC